MIDSISTCLLVEGWFIPPPPPLLQLINLLNQVFISTLYSRLRRARVGYPEKLPWALKWSGNQPNFFCTKSYLCCKIGFKYWLSLFDSCFIPWFLVLPYHLMVIPVFFKSLYILAVPVCPCYLYMPLKSLYPPVVSVSPCSPCIPLLSLHPPIEYRSIVLYPHVVHISPCSPCIPL